MEVSKVGIGSYVTIAGALMGMDQIDAKEAYGWLKSRSRLLESLAENVRFMNDLTGFEVNRHEYIPLLLGGFLCNY